MPRAHRGSGAMRRCSLKSPRSRLILKTSREILDGARKVLGMTAAKWAITLGGVIGAFFPSTDRPGWWLTGPSGAGKTTRGRMIGRVGRSGGVPVRELEPQARRAQCPDQGREFVHRDDGQPDYRHPGGERLLVQPAHGLQRTGAQAAQRQRDADLPVPAHRPGHEPEPADRPQAGRLAADAAHPAGRAPTIIPTWTSCGRSTTRSSRG